MRRKRAFKRGKLVNIFVAGAIGYLIGNWHAAAIRATDPSAAQTVALRFPQGWADRTSVAGAASGFVPASAMAMPDPQVALFDPRPMIPQAAGSQQSEQPAVDHATILPPSVPPAAVQAAAAEAVGSAPARVPDAALAPVPVPQQRASEVAKPEAKPRRPVRESKAVAAVMHRRASQPRYFLDNVQIASIKRHLHLTPDQERMWPAVEAALRNIAYEREREARRHGAIGRAQLAALDPNSAAVQDLKSVAIPLIMSFNDEQKDEVRNLARNMGLDQLASEF
jgi:hypothetical protein